MNSTSNIYINKDNVNNSNQKIFYSSSKVTLNIREKIESIFSYTNIVYDKRVIIKTNEEEIEKKIIAKDQNSLITDSYEVIPIENIINITVIE